MRELISLFTRLHKKTQRDYIGRMNDNKVACMKVAKKYDKDYWDGDRRYGYGGYRYDGRWKVIAEALIEKYKLKKDAKEEVKKNLFKHRAEDVYPFGDKQFDLVISFTTLHNLRLYALSAALKEIERVGKNKFIVVESYRNEHELFNLECWALTCESFFAPDEWIWLFNLIGYTGDYEFIYFE